MFLALLPLACLAQPKNPAPPAPPLERAEGERQARALVANLLAQKPAQYSSNSAIIRIRDTNGHRQELPVSFQILPTPTNYLTIYETLPSNSRPGPTTLSISHADGQPNQYSLSETTTPGAAAQPKMLSGADLMTPFAGLDFCAADLGLEFLHWPDQRVLRKEMRKSQSCDVLESRSPQPRQGGYARVVSWIAVNQPDDTVIVHADGFDARDKLLKEFDPKKIEKLNGMWQLEEMEMRNVQAGSRTFIEFNLDGKPH